MTFQLGRNDLSYWSPTRHDWVLEAGLFDWLDPTALPRLLRDSGSAAP